jgi:putative endonuclease
VPATSPTPPNSARQQLGHAGEDRVITHYQDLGFELLDRNWHDGRRGEIDLVFALNTLIVICEVKTRRTDTYGDGLEAVTPTKQKRLRHLAAAWMTAHRDLVNHRCAGDQAELRIDVAAVRLGIGPPVIEVVEGAC